MGCTHSFPVQANSRPLRRHEFAEPPLRAQPDLGVDKERLQAKAWDLWFACHEQKSVAQAIGINEAPANR